MSKPLIKLFLSYAHDDDGDTQDVAEFLKELNKCCKASKYFCYELWIDRDLLIGDEWHAKITGSLAACDYGLMLVSLSLVTSDYIREYELPVLLESKRALPVGFQKIDLKAFDLQGLLPQQIFRHQQKFYGELEKKQERAGFVQALFQEIEERFLRERADVSVNSPVNSTESTLTQTPPAIETGKKTPYTEPPRQFVKKALWLGAGLLSLTALVYALTQWLAAPKPGQVVTLTNDLRLLPIQAGQFEMGGQASDHAYVKPVHTVTFQWPFWISATEITFAQYAAYAQVMQKAMPDDEGWGQGRHPVINVNWHEAKTYAGWLTDANSKGLQCRLPSEAEWEYAARGGSRMAYAWGEQVGRNNANCRGCGSAWEGKEQTAEVGSFPANDAGLRDVHGNVAEWVEDVWHNDYQGAPLDGSAWLSGGSAARRVARGGSWADGVADIRLAHRVSLVPEDRYPFVGFRVVCGVDGG